MLPFCFFSNRDPVLSSTLCISVNSSPAATHKASPKENKALNKLEKICARNTCKSNQKSFAIYTMCVGSILGNFEQEK